MQVLGAGWGGVWELVTLQTPPFDLKVAPHVSVQGEMSWCPKPLRPSLALGDTTGVTLSHLVPGMAPEPSPRLRLWKGKARSVKRVGRLVSEERRKGKAIGHLLCAERSPRLLI